MANRIQVRRDTATNWSNTNPVLSDGEIGYDKTNKLFKVGDGTTAWNSLDVMIPPFAQLSQAQLQSIALAISPYLV